jgi:hypothetical protein
VNKIVAADSWWREQGENRIGSIVIDTLTKAMPGGDQNSVEDTSAVFDVIARIKDAGIVAPVVIIHHNTKGGEQPRGSSNIQAEPDTLLTLTKNEETGQLHLKVLMARSIDDEASYVFDIMTEELGITAQGYNITAPEGFGRDWALRQGWKSARKLSRTQRVLADFAASVRAKHRRTNQRLPAP